MAVVPVAIPVTIPAALIVPTVISLQLQVPPVVASEREVVDPEHTLAVPPIAAGKAFTVTGVILLQLVGNSYVIFGTPAATPVTKPVEKFTVAKAVLLTIQIPPASASLSDIVMPGHTGAIPIITDGNG